MLVTLLVYLLRAIRWQMLIKSMEQDTKLIDCFAALSIGYFVNFAVPRLGEVTRCLSLQKQNKTPFINLLGTVIIERVVDILSLFAVILITLLLQYKQIVAFTKDNLLAPIYNNIVLKIINGNIKIIVATLLVGFITTLFIYYFRKKILTKTPALLLRIYQGFLEGLNSIKKLKQKKTFALLTIIIWIGYLLMTYFWFFVFPETKILSIGASLTILSIGSIGRSIPIQGGGMGAYHFLVAQVAIIYGLSESFGKTLATLIHAGQTLFTFVFGIIGLLVFFVRSINRN
jgi:uncharacterized protein (TIRG00374 family)